MDRSKAKQLRERIDHALAALGKELGMSIKTTGNGGFTATSYVIKVEAAEVGATGEVQSQEARAYRTYAPMFGLPASTLGWEFEAGNFTYKIVGWNSRSRTMPVICDRADGKRFKFNSRSVAAYLAHQSPEEWKAAQPTV
jgi:hypothetical protein